MKILLLTVSFLMMHCISDTTSNDGSDTNQLVSSSSSVVLSSVVGETSSSVGAADNTPSSGVTLSSSDALLSLSSVAEQISSETLTPRESSQGSYDPIIVDTPNQNGTVDNTAAIALAQAEGKVLHEEFKALRVDDPSCSSDACISKKVELDGLLEKLDGLVESNYYAHTYSRIEKYEITSITDDTLFMVARYYRCSDGAVEETVDTKQVPYEIEPGGLHFLVRDCGYGLYSGSSQSLLGNWEDEGSVYTSTEFDCYRDYDFDISHELTVNNTSEHTLSVNETELVREYTFHYNCWIDDMTSSYKEHANYIQYGCSGFEYMEYGLKTEMSYAFADEYVDGTLTYTYKGESCSDSRKMYMDDSIEPDCDEPDCVDDLLIIYCDDLAGVRPAIGDAEYEAWERASDVCYKYWHTQPKF